MFPSIPSGSFSACEEDILQFWLQKSIFQHSVEQRKNGPLFTFYDGPPFATGLPHYGHLLAGTIKDVVLRYQTMKGKYAPRRFGWDCHGLPIENEIEKAQGLSGADAIEKFGIAAFNEACRDIVLRYTGEWKRTVERMGRWVDFSKTWRTMDLDYMESVWWVFEELYKKGLVYEGYKVMPVSAKLGTPLSNFEAGENYKDVDDPSVVVTFPIESQDAAFLAWTTTPWTLVSHLALMVGPSLTYVRLKEHEAGKKFILAEERVAAIFPDPSQYTIEKHYLGQELEGMRYRPPFDLFANYAEKGAFRVILEPSVSVSEGTGIVHAAPAFGEVDFLACKQAGIPLVCPVDRNCRFTEEVPDYQGLFVKEADKAICRKLKEQGRLFSQATIHHRYPFCWRSDTPLIYKAVSSWFVAVEKIKERMLEANNQIHWVPEHLQNGRFGKWLEGARDWCISRNRYWGTPIPLWRAEDGEILVIGSREQLKQATGVDAHDLHRHHIDALEIVCNGKTFKRIPEVFDCWFESGSMPYGQNHYPFENRELFEKSFPADFIGEGLDQTRGWFYTLTVLAAALFDKPAFRNVIVNGIVLAEDGAKMSKRLRNYPDPHAVIDRFGADAIRLYLLHSPAVRADDLCFSEHGVELVLRQILIPLRNALGFFVTYANIYQWKPEKGSHWQEGNLPEGELDRWMLSRLHHLFGEVGAAMDAYRLDGAVEPFVGFIDALTNWYIRRSRRRFWSEEATQDRADAFSTLYRVLMGLAHVIAPSIPFIAEEIYQVLRQEGMPESVHCSDWPQESQKMRDETLERAMESVRVATGLGHALRKEHSMKVRQPLGAAYLLSAIPEERAALLAHEKLIADELNVKKIVVGSDEAQYVHLRAKPQFRILGKKVGKRMPAVQKAIEQLDSAALKELMLGHAITLAVEGEPLEILPSEVEVVREVQEGVIAANSGSITLALDTQLTEELLMEGLARELVNKVNTMRRENGFAVSDRVRLSLATTPRMVQAFGLHGPFIQNEVLAKEVVFEDSHSAPWVLEAMHKEPNDLLDEGEERETLEGEEENKEHLSCSSHWELNGEATSIRIERL